MIKFFYNGLKVNGSKLYKAHYSIGNLTPQAQEKHGYNDKTITIYARDYLRFPQEVRNAFTVENNTDMMTDYFEKDRIRVKEDHPLYDQVYKAVLAAKAHQEKIAAKRRIVVA